MIIEIPRHCSRHALSLNLHSTHVRQTDEDPLPTDEETMAQRVGLIVQGDIDSGRIWT